MSLEKNAFLLLPKNALKKYYVGEPLVRRHNKIQFTFADTVLSAT